MTIDTQDKIAIAALALGKRVFYDPNNEGDFLDYVYIEVPPQAFGATSQAVNGKLRIEKTPHARKRFDAFLKYQRIVEIKARQTWFSTDFAAWVIYNFCFIPNSNIGLFSMGEVAAMRLIDKCKSIYRNLPEQWRSGLGKSSGTEMTIPAINSRIVAFPSTKDAGRGETFSIIGQDEADFHEYLEDNSMAVGPTVDMGGQHIIASTSNKRIMASRFKTIVRGADELGYHKIFTGWDTVPGRDQEWYRQVKGSIGADELARTSLTPEQYMEQEYPATEAEALSPSRKQGYFDHDVLLNMQEEVRKSIRQYPIYSLATGGVVTHINIYQHVSLKGNYVAGTDTSHGVGRDYSVTIMYDYASRRVVADIFSNEIEPDEFAAASIQLMRLYNDPIWCIEDNDRGIEVIKAAKNVYWNLYHRETGGAKGGRTGRVRQPGWHTSDAPDSRPILWAQLATAFRRGDIIIPNEAGLNQCFDIIQNPDNKYRPEAAVGAHDDYPMALGLAWQMIERNPGRFTESQNTVSRTRKKKVAGLRAMWL